MKRFIIMVMLFSVMGFVCMDAGMNICDWHYWAVLLLESCISLTGYWDGLRSGHEK